MSFLWLQERLQALWRPAGERSIRAVRRLSLLAAVGVALVCAPAASASPVLVLGEGGRVHTEADRFLPPTPLSLPAARVPARAAGATAHAAEATVRATLAGMLARGQIGQAVHDQKLELWERALRARAKLTRTRWREQTAAINNVGWLAKNGQFTPSRLGLIFVQLERNTTWWSTADRIPAGGERVRNIASRVLFQFVPGQGLQFHPLANWGRAQSLLRFGYVGQARAMINELIPLGSMRGPALTWEYLFFFGGGRPAWTSGLSQGTALIALSDAYARTRDPRYAAAARQALTLYELHAPLGVRIPTAKGAHYAEYSYAPRLRIINGFVQALNGLWDTWHKLGDARAAALFRAGDAQARSSLRYYDTGGWSRYSNQGSISNLNYHVLLRDFLAGLCQRSRIPAYCAKAAKFTYYLRRYGRPPRPGERRPPLPPKRPARP